MHRFHICHVSINKFNKIYEDLILALEASLTDLGYPCTVGINELRGEAINVLLGSTIFAARHFMLAERVGSNPFIVYQLEPLDESHGLAPQWAEYMDLLEKASWIFEYSPTNLEFYNKKGWNDKVSLLEPGFHKNLEHFKPAKHKNIDVLFYGSPHPRREKIINELMASGVKVNYKNNLFGRELDRSIRHSKIILNIHAWDELPHLETVRLSYLLSNHCLVVSETSSHNPYGEGVKFVDYEGLVDGCIQLLQEDESVRDEIARRGYSAIRANTVADRLAQILGDLESRLGDRLVHTSAVSTHLAAPDCFLDSPRARFPAADASLLSGDLPHGWDQYEARLQVPGLIQPERHFTHPRWDGQPFQGKTLLLHYEQSFGDTLMFVRYAPMVKAMGGNVLLAAQGPLADLVATCQGIDLVIPRGTAPPPFDFHFPLLSLPWLFRTELSSIPAEVPYLKVPESVPNREALTQLLARSEGLIRVGLTWKGRSSLPRDSGQSIPPAALAPLAALPEVAWHSFQREDGSEAPFPGIQPVGPSISTFSDLAHALSAMDLVITVDTAVAHLAGALGIPALLLLAHEPDWPWLLERDDSPWYPTLRLYRQQVPGDWESVVQRVIRDLTNPE